MDIFDVVIVGGGPAGMSAAFELRDRNILLLEKSERLGGRLYSLPRGDYWMNLGGHLLPGPESRIRTMMNSLGLEPIKIPGNKFGLYFGGKVHSPKSVSLLPFTLPLTLGERLSFVRLGLKLKQAVARWQANTAERQGEPEFDRRARMASLFSTLSFRDFIKLPAKRVDGLFKSAGRRAAAELEDQAAGVGISLFAAVWGSTGGGLSTNLKGGSGLLGAEMGRFLGDRVQYGADVSRIEKGEKGVQVTFELNGGERKVTARQVIVAIPAFIAGELVAGVPGELTSMLKKVRYGAFPTMGIITNETGAMPWDDLYAITTPDASFDMLFNHANPLRTPGVRKPGGSLMVYAGGQPATDLMKLTDEEIRDRYLNDLIKIFPQMRSIIAETKIQRWFPGNTYRAPNFDFDPMLAYCARSDVDIHFAGDYFAELGTMETAAKTGFEASMRVRAKLNTV